MANISYIALQLNMSTMIPPIVGPIAGRIPIINPNIPINNAHFSSGSILKIMIWHIGINIPVPTASKILPAINVSIFGAKNAIKEPMKNRIRDVVNIDLILNLFVIYAVGGIITPITRRNTEYVHCAVAELMLKYNIYCCRLVVTIL